MFLSRKMSSSSHHPFGHLNHNNNNSNSLGGGISSVNHNNLQPQINLSSGFEDFDDVDNEQTQQQQELLFDDDDNMDDSDQGKSRPELWLSDAICWDSCDTGFVLDTEEASETELGSSGNHRNIDEPIEIKEQ